MRKHKKHNVKLNFKTMAHKDQGTGSWKKNRDKHQKADRINSDKKRKKENWDGESGRKKKK